MPVRNISPETLGCDTDWEGNNVAFTCPVCNKVFIVSAYFHEAEGKKRDCPSCKKSTGYVTDSAKKGGKARIEWEWS
jgi:hypothetical protein